MKEEKIIREPERPEIVELPLDIPFKEFMPGQIIESEQFNDDMKDIEDKVNEVVLEHNNIVKGFHQHKEDYENPHQVTAHQTGTYTGEEIDVFVDDLKNGNLNDGAIENRVLADGCVDGRVIKDGCITVSKADSQFGNQLNISNNISITDRYTKTETDQIIQDKVGDGTYSKEQIDGMFEEYQAGTIIDGTIDASKLKDDVGQKIDISANPSILDRYSKAEVNNLITKNGLPKDWGNLEEVEEETPPSAIGNLPIANVMVADEFPISETPVLNIDVKEVIDARGDEANLKNRLDNINTQLEANEKKVSGFINIKNFGAKGDGITDDTMSIKNCIEYAKNNNLTVSIPNGTYKITSEIIIPSDITIKGEDKFNTIILSTLDKPIFTTIGGGVGSKNITISNIHFAPRGTTKTRYSIDMINTINTTIKDCHISGQQMTISDVEGIIFRKESNYTGSHFINRVERCQLSACSVVIESTDSYILNSEIWGNNRDKCIHLLKSSQFVIGNQLVPSMNNGAILIEDTKDNYDVEIIRILNNYFDGSYSGILNSGGIIGKKLRLSNIVGNDFWNIKKDGITLESSHSVNVNSNIFTDCNRGNNFYNDINLDKCAMVNIVANNHKQSISHTNKGKAINVTNSTSFNRVTDNNIYFAANYQSSTFTDREKVCDNFGISEKIGSYKICSLSPTTTTIGTETPFPFDSLVSKSDDLITVISGGKIRFDMSGNYIISFNIGSSSVTSTRFVVFVYKNNVRGERILDKILNGSECASGVLIDYFSNGETLELRYYTDKAMNLSPNVLDNYISVKRLN